MQTPHPEPDGRTDPRRTWRIVDDRRLPALEPFADDVRRYDPVVLHESLWDTDDRTLAAEGIELLRSDAGWSVDRGDGPVPVGPDLDGGDPLDPDHVPRDAVEVFLRGRDVRAVRVRDTVTTLVELRGKDGRLRAEVADVRIDEGDQETAVLRSGRWWALSDDGHPGAVARAAERALADAADPSDRGPGSGRGTGSGGVPPAESGSGATTGSADAPPLPRLDGVDRVDRRGVPRGPRRGTAAAALRDVLRSLRADLVTVDPRVRADDDGAVHELRKVLRRLRSVLAAYRGALDPGATEVLRAELADIARIAGVSRDAEVLCDRLPRSAARAPDGYVDVGTVEQIGADALGARDSAAAELRHALRSPAWFAALDDLDSLVDRAPRGPHADDAEAAFTLRRIERERARVARTLDRPLEGLDDLHAVRKAVRRLRYAVEAAGPAPDLGKRRLGLLARVQESLGEVLDASHAAEAYRELALLAARGGTDTFGYGVLATTERAAAEQGQDHSRALLDRLRG